MKTRAARALFGAAVADLRRPGAAMLLLAGCGMVAVATLPRFLRYTAASDRLGLYDPHYIEHMVVQIGGLLAGTALHGMFRVLSALLGLKGEERIFAWLVVAVGSAVDLAVMNPAVDLWVDRFALAHAAEHGALFLLNGLIGAAWAYLVGPTVWAVLAMSLIMAGMVAAGGG